MPPVLVREAQLSAEVVLTSVVERNVKLQEACPISPRLHEIAACETIEVHDRAGDQLTQMGSGNRLKTVDGKIAGPEI